MFWFAVRALGSGFGRGIAGCLLAIGGFGAYVPYEILWELDQSEGAPTADDRFVEIAKLADFPDWLASISR